MAALHTAGKQKTASAPLKNQPDGVNINMAGKIVNNLLMSGK